MILAWNDKEEKEGNNNKKKIWYNIKMRNYKTIKSDYTKYLCR